MEVKYILNTRSKKSIFFLSHRKVCKRPPPTSTFFQSTPLCKGRQRQTIYYHRTSVFNPHPIRGRQAVLFGQQTDGSRKPHRKGVLLPVLTQLQQGFQSLLLTADVRASNCLCRASGSNNASSRLHSPSYRASNFGFIVPPLTFTVSSAIIDFAAFRRCVGL